MDLRETNGRTGDELFHEEIGPVEQKARRGLKPYQKPGFRFERVFEVSALSCGKMVSTQLQCRSIHKSS
jgi:hypothetical protein